MTNELLIMRRSSSKFDKYNEDPSVIHFTGKNVSRKAQETVIQGLLVFFEHGTEGEPSEKLVLACEEANKTTYIYCFL